MLDHKNKDTNENLCSFIYPNPFKSLMQAYLYPWSCLIKCLKSKGDLFHFLKSLIEYYLMTNDK